MPNNWQTLRRQVLNSLFLRTSRFFNCSPSSAHAVTIGLGNSRISTPKPSAGGRCVGTGTPRTGPFSPAVHRASDDHGNTCPHSHGKTQMSGTQRTDWWISLNSESRSLGLWCVPQKTAKNFLHFNSEDIKLGYGSSSWWQISLTPSREIFTEELNWSAGMTES